uniref:Uncharacterized protein AlNc14C535G12081 n=1 Tax=Albugo laibachii Nc14 TaxID=890382 RepID=F0X0Z3_9STRA|nr:conserved hypothetical protein [Albugo laibachii Nc14]|eukprot:CCA27439.1 conserved hypothetical protein [Albugo laibachii Nc14]
MATSFKLFRLRSMVSVDRRNRTIDKTCSSAPLIPEEWQFYSKYHEWTHAGEYKYRGKGKRIRQDTRPMGCGAKINACVQIKRINGVFTSRQSSLNTPMKSASTYDLYSSTRAAWSEEMVDTINLLRQYGAKKKYPALHRRTLVTFTDHKRHFEPDIQAEEAGEGINSSCRAATRLDA